jgi:hypothetical protein
MHGATCSKIAKEFSSYPYALGKEGSAMTRIRLGTNFTVFALFFGVAALETVQTQDWLKAAFWLAIGSVFLVADKLKVER